MVTEPRRRHPSGRPGGGARTRAGVHARGAQSLPRGVSLLRRRVWAGRARGHVKTLPGEYLRRRGRPCLPAPARVPRERKWPRASCFPRGRPGKLVPPRRTGAAFPLAPLAERRSLAAREGRRPPQVGRGLKLFTPGGLSGRQRTRNPAWRPPHEISTPHRWPRRDVPVASAPVPVRWGRLGRCPPVCLPPCPCTRSSGAGSCALTFAQGPATP